MKYLLIVGLLMAQVSFAQEASESEDDICKTTDSPRGAKPVIADDKKDEGQTNPDGQKEN